MSSKKGQKNVRREYRQSFISGFEHLAQSRDENGNRKTDIVVESSAPVKRGQGMYQVSITCIIEQVSDDSSEYIYRILLNDDPDISVLPIGKRSKKATGQAASLPKKGIKGGDSFSMVYGIHKSGKRALSHTDQHPIHRVSPSIYSFLLGALDRAIECTILIPEDSQRNDDTGQRVESTSTQESLGTDKKKGRSEKVRAKVLPEALPKEPANVVENDGQVLGQRQGDGEPRPIEVGSGTDDGTATALDFSDGRTPDIGF